MKVLIVSDNHNERKIIEALPKIVHADLYLHLGDSEFSYEDDILKAFHCVRGNTDFDMQFKDEDLYNGSIFFTHGHLYNVNSNRDMLAAKAKALGATYALYGHTHVSRVEKINDVYCINPGSIQSSRSEYPESYAILDTDKNVVTYYSRKHEQIEIIELK